MSPMDSLRFYVILSIVACVMAMVAAVNGYQEDADVDRTDRAIVGMALLLVSVLGISMALRPNWRCLLTEPERAGDDEGDGAGNGLPGPRRRGHHPECEPFSGHTLSWGGRVRCAGCTGLTVGALVTIAMTIGYVLLPTPDPALLGPGLVLCGLALVAVDLYAAAMGASDPMANMALNGLMVMGFGFVSIGMLEATGDWSWGLVGVVFSVLWMDTRIQLSRWNHVATCMVCPEACTAYHP